MKCVIYGNTNADYSWFLKTFRQGLKLNGHEVHLIDYRSTHPTRAYQMLQHLKPDVMFTHISFHNVYPIPLVLQMYADCRKKLGIKVVHVLMDAREEPRYSGDLSQAFDCALLSQTKNLKKFKNYWKIPVYFQPYSSLVYDKIVPVAQDLRFDEAVFTGNPHSHPDRTGFINLLQRQMPIRTFITQSGNDLRHRTRELSSSAWAILGLCTGYQLDHYIDVRPFQYMGAGAVMISRRFKGMDDIIPPDLYYAFDGYNAQSADKVKEIYYNDCFKKLNTEMRKKAFKFIQQKHSCKVRLADIMDCIFGKRNKVRVFTWDWKTENT